MRFRVMTYNIHRAIGVDGRFSPERIVHIVEAHQADIVLLQEVDEGVPRSRELDLARELAEALGYAHRAVGHNVSLRKGRYGNATLSRYPIVVERNLDLTVGPYRRRGCQHTGILLEKQGSSRRIDVFNLHLGLLAHERQKQVALLSKSRELSGLGSERACLVGGDFNDWRSRLRPLFAEELKLRPADDGSARSPRPIATFPSFFPSGPLDTFYYRGPLRLLSARRCRQKLSRVASDHLPLVADFELH